MEQAGTRKMSPKRKMCGGSWDKKWGIVINMLVLFTENVSSLRKGPISKN